MRRVRRIVFFILCFFSTCLHAQDITNFTQFFINPYSINPSYAGVEGRGALFLAYRKQWTSIEGAPTTANFTFHAPTQFGLNYGLNVTSDTRGILKTSSAMLTLGYTVTIDKHNFIRFGLSAGSAFNSVDTKEFGTTTDPVLTKLLDKNMYLIGNAGLSVHLKSFHFGASLPNIFTPAYVSTTAFSVKEIKPFQSVIVHASNRFYFGGDKHVFEPYLLYRINKDLPAQLEAAAVVHLNHLLWVGGSYKQDFGISALGGVKLQNFLLIGGSYSLKNTGINELNSPSIEIQLSYIFGAKRKESPVYSFVNTVKEKEKRKTPTQLAAEKKKAEEERKKHELALAQKQQQELAKKEEEKKKLELAKKQEAEKKQQEIIAKQTPPKQEPVQQKPIVQQPVKQDPVVRQPVQQEPVQQPAQQKLVVQEPIQQPVQQKPIVQQPVKQDPVVQQPVQQEPVKQQPPKRHDGGPRLKSDILTVELPSYDTAHHEEQSRLARIEEHASDPNEHHGDDPSAHPNSERHEFVKRGAHAEELKVGDYVIAAVFKSDGNANHFSDGLAKLGFKADYGHLTEKGLWYVYISFTDDINKAKAERDKFRKMKIFRDSWLLTVHH